MTDTFLARARQAILDRSETVILQGIAIQVPPVPTGAMANFCDLIELWEKNGIAFSQNQLTDVEFVKLALPLVNKVTEIFWITASTLDPEISLEGLQLLIDTSNFIHPLMAMMRSSGLIAKEVSVESAIAEGAKNTTKKVTTKKDGRTGTRSPAIS